MFWYLIANSENRLRKIIIIIGILLICLQTSVTSILLYSDFFRYQEDVKIANQINTQLENYDTSKPIIFVGGCQEEKVLIKGDILGCSFFNWDTYTEWGINKRAIGFMKVLGMNYTLGTLNQINKAIEESKSILANFPDENSIVEEEDFIIIKMSEVNLQN